MERRGKAQPAAYHISPSAHSNRKPIYPQNDSNLAKMKQNPASAQDNDTAAQGNTIPRVYVFFRTEAHCVWALQ